MKQQKHTVDRSTAPRRWVRRLMTGLSMVAAMASVARLRFAEDAGRLPEGAADAVGWNVGHDFGSCCRKYAENIWSISSGSVGN